MKKNQKGFLLHKIIPFPAAIAVILIWSAIMLALIFNMYPSIAIAPNLDFEIHHPARNP